MAYALTFIGLIMIVTGINNTHVALARQLQGDFTGQGNFVVWVLAIASVGALGYVQQLRSFSHYFMALILVALVLSHKGFLAQFQDALNKGPLASAAANSNGVAAANAVPSNSPGLFGQAPSSAGQSKFNGWMNYFFGLGQSAPAAPATP